MELENARAGRRKASSCSFHALLHRRELLFEEVDDALVFGVRSWAIRGRAWFLIIIFRS